MSDRILFAGIRAGLAAITLLAATRVLLAWSPEEAFAGVMVAVAAGWGFVQTGRIRA